MNRWSIKVSALIVLLSPFVCVQSAVALQAESGQTGATREHNKQEEAAGRSKLLKSHLANGNAAMHDAQTIRRELDAATGEQKSTLLGKMNADYQTAITEYQEALENTRIADAEAIRPIGLVRLIRNGLISEQKAVEMEVQDKNLHVILSNLGMAYSGVGDYDDAIPLLQEATISKPEPTTYMQLGTDFAQVGKIPQANATCDKIGGLDPSASGREAACYRNIAVVLMNEGKLADAVAPLGKTTRLDPRDALAWKLLGDALSNTITTKEEGGKVVYIIPPGTVEAYQTYLQLEPNGRYAGQVKATLDGFAQLGKGAPASVGTKKML
jgi:tetratricopeptide (TPR) repeat protein